MFPLLEQGSRLSLWRLLPLVLLGLLPTVAGSVGETAAAAAAGGGSRGLAYTVALKPGPRQTQRRFRSGEATDFTAATPETVRMMDHQGRAYTCELPSLSQAAPANLLTTNVSPSSSPPPRVVAPTDPASNKDQPSDSQVAPASPLPAANTIDSIMALLSVGCIKKNTGWWTYEVCHSDEVRQYHPEHNKVDSSQSWSLGRIDLATRPLVVHTERDASASAAGGSSHVAVEFAGGQFCDEIKAQRSGELRYVCGDAELSELSHQPSIIQSIEEPSKCRYTIVVAVPTLCALLPKQAINGKEQSLGGRQNSAKAEEETSGKTSADGSKTSSESALAHAISSVAEQYEGACFYRVDGWWTYELCINKHVRQFRQLEKQETEENEEEGDEVEQEFYLGLFQGSDPPDLVGPETNAATDAGEHAQGATKPRTKGKYVARLHRHDPSRSFASADYSAGDACEVGPEWESDIARLEQSRYRETEVRFQCAENGRDSLVSVREVTTCAYLLVFASARLCEVPEFSLAAMVSLSRSLQLTRRPKLRHICLT